MDCTPKMNLYDCTDRSKLASFHVHTKHAAPSARAVVVRWSPDGSPLLLSSVTGDLVSLWAPMSFDGRKSASGFDESFSAIVSPMLAALLEGGLPSLFGAWTVTLQGWLHLTIFDLI